MVIEAIVEKLEVKQNLFKSIEGKLKPGAVLATNTSSITIEEIAAPLADPGRLIGIHFFNPVAQMPLVDLIDYPVLNGKEGAKVQVTLPFAVRNDTLYQVEMNVRGDAFRATVNGHVVDSWTDNSLRAGGVGFVSGQGEAARVRWIRVSDRDDVIGRVCSYLSARADQPSDDPVLLSASHYTLFRRPGQ